VSTPCRDIRNNSAMSLLFWLLMPIAHAATDARTLPSSPQLSAVEGKDYSLHHVVDRASRHLSQGMQVTLIDVHTGIGDWARPDLGHVRAYKTNMPTRLRGQFQLFFGDVVGWMLVPAGWRVQLATIGADGNTGYTFISPAGAGSGWLDYGITPACLACLLGEADGLLPGAWEQLIANHYLHGPMPWRPVPAPDRLNHPDVCTALLGYRSGGLSVHGAVLSSEPMAALNNRSLGDLSLAEVYVALPSSKSASAEAVVAGFRRAFSACHSPKGW
jgi:hypothetical protein